MERGVCQRFEPRQVQRQLVAPFALGQRVNLVRHHPAQPAEDARRVLPAQHQRQGFGGGQQDMRRVRPLAPPGGLPCVARPVLHPDRQPGLLDGDREVPPDIRRQRLQRRDVEGVEPGARLLGQIAQGGQEPGQRLAAAGRRDQQTGASCLSMGEHLHLMSTQVPAAVIEPAGKFRRQDSRIIQRLCARAPFLGTRHRLTDTRPPPLAAITGFGTT